ncbi:MAG: alginate export family protein [Candidatus Omnitrophota bacterium]
MGKRLMVLLALALVVGLAFGPAYAEVQNVKVSGDIIASGVARSHFNLSRNNDDSSDLKQTFLMTQTRVRVDADLTDNVMATVRLINERIWNGQNDHGVSGLNTDTNTNSIDLDLAYVTLKEFLYSPLTLTIGRQEIKFGNSLIIGNAKVRASGISIPSDLTERKAFDAIRATLNYDPLVVDLVYAQVKQDNSVDRNTISLTGVNATYAVNNKLNVSGYYWLKRDNNQPAGAGVTSRTDQLSTIGGLVSATPVEDLNLSAEAAYQFGKNRATANQEKHNAWAFQGMANYTMSKLKMTPKIGGSITYLSGNKSSDDKNDGWDPMFYDQKLNNIVYTLIPFSNLIAYNLQASVKPKEDVTVSLVYGYYDAAKKSTNSFTVPNTYDNGSSYYSGSYTGKKHIGSALDANITYDYTEDVQFGLTGGYFLPGNGLTVDNRNATQLIGSMKVVF